MARHFIDLQYKPAKFSVDMINRGEEYKKWYFESATGEMGYNDEPVGPYRDLKDFYSYWRSLVEDDMLEKYRKLGLTINEYLNEDKYGISVNIEGDSDLIEQFKNEDPRFGKGFLRQYEGDGHVTCTEVTSLLHPDRSFESIEEWYENHPDTSKKAGDDHSKRKSVFIIERWAKLSTDGKHLLDYKKFKDVVHADQYFKEYWTERTPEGIEDEANVGEDDVYHYELIER